MTQIAQITRAADDADSGSRRSRRWRRWVMSRIHKQTVVLRTHAIASGARRSRAGGRKDPVGVSLHAFKPGLTPAGSFLPHRAASRPGAGRLPRYLRHLCHLRPSGLVHLCYLRLTCLRHLWPSSADTMLVNVNGDL
jgi:hypothetical protein